MRQYAVIVIVLAIVLSEEDGGLIGTCWYTITSEKWAVLVSRSERNMINRMAAWERLVEERRKTAFREAVFAWDRNCRAASKLSA